MGAFSLTLVCFSTVCYTSAFTAIPAINISTVSVEELNITNGIRRLSDDNAGWRAQRIVNQVTGSPVTVAVNRQSTLYAQPGQVASLYFDVTNNNWRNFFYFYCRTLYGTVQTIQPYEGWISAGGSLTVRVLVRVNGAQSTSGMDTVTFTAVAISAAGQDPTYIRAYLHVGQQGTVSDSSSPDVSYYINGNCWDAHTPSTCAAASWGFTATIRNKQSGLLLVETIPPGFVITSDFIAGTTDEVRGHFSASCCLSQVDLVATDLNGNEDRTSIDINNVWLSAGSVVAIVLGCIILVVLLITICCAVGFCIRKRRKTSSFTMHT